MPWARSQGAPSTITVNGKEYEWYRSNKTKKEATDSAKAMRSIGYYATVRTYYSTIAPTDYSVYIREKPKDWESKVKTSSGLPKIRYYQTNKYGKVKYSLIEGMAFDGKGRAMHFANKTRKKNGSRIRVVEHNGKWYLYVSSAGRILRARRRT